MAMTRIAALDDVPENGNRAFEINGQSVLVCRTSAGVFALENMCSHAYSLLEGGKVRGKYLFCPLHGMRIDLRDGSPSGQLTKKAVAVYPVMVEEGIVMAEIDAP